MNTDTTSTEPTSTEPMRTVDAHAHVILPQVEQAVAGQPGLQEHRELDAHRNGPESMAVSGRMVGERIARLTQAPVRLADMDAAGVDAQIVSPSPSHYHYWAARISPSRSAAWPARASPSTARRPRTGCTAWAWSRSSTPR
nr:hypothetical protein GCM10020093_009040 [Planobispora longispora]